MTQTLAELTSVDDPAGPLLREWLEAGQVDAQILAVEPERRDQCLVGMQVTLRSVLGALAYETGGPAHRPRLAAAPRRRPRDLAVPVRGAGPERGLHSP